MVNGDRASFTGIGSEEAKIFYYILYKVPSGKYGNMSGKSQGILKEKIAPECGKPIC